MSASRSHAWPQHAQLGFGYGSLVVLGISLAALGLAVAGAVLAGVGAGIGGAAVGLAGGVVAERGVRARVRADRIRRLPPVRIEGDVLEIPAGVATLRFRLDEAHTIRTSHWRRAYQPSSQTPAQWLTALEIEQGDLRARVWSSAPVAVETLRRRGLGVEPSSSSDPAPGPELALEDLLALHDVVRRARR